MWKGGGTISPDREEDDEAAARLLLRGAQLVVLPVCGCVSVFVSDISKDAFFCAHAQKRAEK